MNLTSKNCITECGHYERIKRVSRKGYIWKGRHKKKCIFHELWCFECVKKLKDIIEEFEYEDYLNE